MLTALMACLHAAQASICTELQRIENAGGLGSLALDGAQLAQFDVNGDGRPDVIEVSCPGSGPEWQADPCVVQVTPAGGNAYTLEAWRAYVIGYKGQPFVVATGMWEEGALPRKIAIHRLGATRAERVCALTRRDPPHGAGVDLSRTQRRRPVVPVTP